MHKPINLKALREWKGLRMFVAVSFTIFLAGLVACSTNYMPGNGQPTTSPQYGPMPHASTYGSSSGTEGSVPQSRLIVAPDNNLTPMYSSSSEAIAVLAGHQGRFLGYANPGPASPNYGLDVPTGQFVAPSQYANPESTVNSSISSTPTPVITSGVGGGDIGGAVVIGNLSSAATTGGVTASAVVPSTVTAPVFSNAGTLTTPTNTAAAVSAGLFAAGPGISGTSTAANQNTGLLTPTMSSANTPSPTAAANPPVASVGTTASATVTPATTTTTPAGKVAGSATGIVSMLAPVRIPAVTTAATTPVITQPITAVPASRTRVRAVSQPIPISAPLTIPGRVARPVRMTTSGNGTITITNQ